MFNRNILQESINILNRNITIARYYKDYIDENIDLELKLRDNCPFHDDGTASFTYKPDENYFHCFGCGVGGKVPHLHFLKRTRLDEVKNYTIYDAVIELADLYKIQIPLKNKKDLYIVDYKEQYTNINFNTALLDRYIRTLTNQIESMNLSKDKKIEYYNLLDVVISSDYVIEEKLKDIRIIEKLILRNA